MVAKSLVTGPRNARESNRVEFEGGSVASKLLASTLSATLKPAIHLWALAPGLPWPYGVVDHIGRVLRSVPGTTRRSATLRNCSAETTRPATTRTDRYVVYMHGGAFLVGGRYLHRQLISRIAAALSSEVVAVDYRMLPNHTIADGVEDCVDAYRFALAKGIPPEQIAFMGDSAGAYLVFMAAVVAREQGLPMPGAIVSMAPVIDFDLHAKLDAPSAATDALFTKGFARTMHRLVLDHCPMPHTRRQIVDEDLSGLPPSLIQVSSTELLYPDAERLAVELAKAGVPHQLQVWLDQVHVFQAAASIVPEAARALTEVTEFVESAFAAHEAVARSVG
ncbi:alpha/beta hydrolase fold domain-containing protein [Antrihabitans stalactiti]|uniref:Alpha/beta hydrolase n=1 Tax=Antrihabitans stalactiti TaxID=2584121 RepID=A0A848K9C4_9NOCA|nr:alpha/beta hydrolase [Antrihabitans stalactiti]